MTARARGQGIGGRISLLGLAGLAAITWGCADGGGDEELGEAQAAVEGQLPAQTPITVEITSPGDNTVVPPGPVAVHGNATVGAGTIVQDTALIYVIDVSGSTSAGGGCGGDFNGDGPSNTVLDCELVAAQALDAQAAAQGNILEAGIVVFGEHGAVGDLDGIDSGVQPRRPPGSPGIGTVLHSIRVGRVNQFTPFDVGQSTSYGNGIQAAVSALSGSSAPRKIVVFLSDGMPTAPPAVSAVLGSIPAGVRFFTFAVGNAAACSSSSPLGSLQQLATATGGSCTHVTNVAQLPAILPGVIGSQLTKLELTVDGVAVDPGSVTLTPALPLAGPNGTLFSASPVITAPGPHQICAHATGTDAGGEGQVHHCITVIVNSTPEARCKDVTVNANGSCEGSASIDNGSFDPDGQPLTCTQLPPPPYGQGANPATLTCQDPFLAMDSCTGTVTVVDVTPPTISCPASQVRECVAGQATASYAASASDNCSAVVPACTPPSGASFPLGTTPVTCSAADSSGNSSSCGFSVSVTDTQAPTVTVKATPVRLWPPNHQYEAFSLASCVSAVTDACGGTLDVGATGQILRITSDEPEKAPGSGNTCKDAVITGAATANLRAERIGSSDGRVYTVVFAVTDAAGNATQASCKVVVPHDQGQGSNPVDSGCKFCVGTGCGSCPGSAPSCN